jgi:hypothetical protein
MPNAKVQMSNEIPNPNPDIEKIDVANHEDLERFF